MIRPVRVGFVCSVSVLLLACGGGLIGVAPEAMRAPAELDFGRVFVGYPVAQELALQNPARMRQDVSLSWPSPFEGPAHVSVGAGLEEHVVVLLRPGTPGLLRETLDVGGAQVALRAQVEVPLPCDAGACELVAFNPDAGACVTGPAPEGARCDAECLVAAHCEGGLCVGQARSCSDGDGCTDDACVPGAGCVHADATCDVPPASCQVPFCDLARGCGTTSVVDGVRCGPDDCDANTARVCINGACVMRARPSNEWCVTVVGGTAGGWGLLDGKGAEARLWADPFGLDARGVVTMIHDSSLDSRIRRIGPEGAVATVVSGAQGMTPGDGLGSAVFGSGDELLTPHVDSGGNVWFVEMFPGLVCLRSTSPVGFVRTLRCLPATATFSLAPGREGGFWIGRVVAGQNVATLVDRDGGVAAEVLANWGGASLAVETDGGFLVASQKVVGFARFDGGFEEIERYDARNFPRVHHFTQTGQWLVTESDGGRDCVLRLDGPGAGTVLARFPACLTFSRVRMNDRGQVVALFPGVLADLVDGGWRPRAGVRVDSSEFTSAQRLEWHAGAPWRITGYGEVGAGDAGLSGNSSPIWTLGARACGGALLAVNVMQQATDGGPCATLYGLLPDAGWSASVDTCDWSSGGNSFGVGGLTCPPDDAWATSPATIATTEAVRVHLPDGAVKRWPFPVSDVLSLRARDATGFDFSSTHALGRFGVDGGVTWLAGDVTQGGLADGVGSAARFMRAMDFSDADDGTRYVADFGAAAIRAVSPTGTVKTVIRLQDGPIRVLAEPGPRPGLWITVQDALLYARPPP